MVKIYQSVCKCAPLKLLYHSHSPQVKEYCAVISGPPENSLLPSQKSLILPPSIRVLGTWSANRIDMPVTEQITDESQLERCRCCKCLLLSL
jgi:hypothetical protein